MYPVHDTNVSTQFKTNKTYTYPKILTNISLGHDSLNNGSEFTNLTCNTIYIVIDQTRHEEIYLYESEVIEIHIQNLISGCNIKTLCCLIPLMRSQKIKGIIQFRLIPYTKNAPKQDKLKKKTSE